LPALADFDSPEKGSWRGAQKQHASKFLEKPGTVRELSEKREK
jgi:hypothetical protein